MTTQSFNNSVLGNTIQTGISQPPGMTPKKVISMFGQEYILCKDAADSTVAFPHSRRSSSTFNSADIYHRCT